MSSPRGVKRKQPSQPEPELSKQGEGETSGTQQQYQKDEAEQIARRAKLDVTKGTECECLSGPLPQHIRAATSMPLSFSPLSYPKHDPDSPFPLSCCSKGN